MTKPRTETSLRQMLDYAREALGLVQGINRADFETNRLLNLALVHLLEILGEAANRVANQLVCLYEVKPEIAKPAAP